MFLLAEFTFHVIVFLMSLFFLVSLCLVMGHLPLLLLHLPIMCGFSSLLPISSLSFPQSSSIPFADSVLFNSNHCSESSSSFPSENPCSDSALSVLLVSFSAVSIESILPVYTDAPSLSASVPTRPYEYKCTSYAYQIQEWYFQA